MNNARVGHLFLLFTIIVAVSAASFAGVLISVTVAPPPLPVYVQPPCPEPGYMWVPGYWAWSDEGYYWVPGTWVPAPAVGLLWTPGYWGWNSGFYVWNPGYWGPHIGFYGGVNYGFGYNGVGFVGGEWRGGAFFYNSAVMNVRGPRVTNVYVNRTVIVRNANRVSYNGGTGGLRAGPTPAQQVAMREHHVERTQLQIQHQSMAERNPQLLVRRNGGRPAIAATGRSTDFSSRSIVPARAAGGRVAPSSLNATAKSMPSAPKGSPARGAAPAPRPTNTAKPPSANARPSPPPTHNALSPRASTPPPPHNSRPPRASAPPRRTPPPARPAPQAHAAPQPHAAPPPRGGPPPSHAHGAPPTQKNEHEKR